MEWENQVKVLILPINRKLGDEDLLYFRDRFDVPLTDKQVKMLNIIDLRKLSRNKIFKRM